ncbi:hypothetical protein B0I68_002134 [Clostridium beijerinckii]|nr:hypothetical protein [Clostridium beijerinckii]
MGKKNDILIEVKDLKNTFQLKMELLKIIL